MRRTHLAIYSLIVVVFAGCGRSADPTAQLLAEVRRNPDSVEARVALGDAYMQDGAHHNAYIQYSTACELDSNSFEATLGLARAEEALNDVEAAEEHVTRALELKPDVPEALALKGKLHLRTDQPEEAVAAFEKALDLQPGNEDAHMYLPISYLRIGEPAKAEEAARAAVKLMPDSVDAHLALALVLVSRDKATEAETILRKAMELDPANPMPPLRLAELLVRDGRDLTEAIQLADRSAEIDAGRGDPDAIAAMALRKLGRNEEAIRRLHTAAMAHPRNVRLWMMLASAYREMGDEGAAARAAGMAFRFAPRRRLRTTPDGSGASSDTATEDGLTAPYEEVAP